MQNSQSLGGTESTQYSTPLIKEYPNFLSSEELELAVKYFDLVEEFNLWDQSTMPYWDKRIYEINHMLDHFSDRKAYATMVNILLRKRDIINEFDTRKINSDSMKFMKMVDGEGQAIHADNAELNGGPPIAPWRVYASLIYLNDTYEGGQTFFENYGIDIEPEAGKLLVFSCDIDHAHGVRIVRSEMRKTLISFWGYESVNKMYRLKDDR